jgi:hypothetical protein
MVEIVSRRDETGDHRERVVPPRAAWVTAKGHAALSHACASG